MKRKLEGLVSAQVQLIVSSFDSDSIALELFNEVEQWILAQTSWSAFEKAVAFTSERFKLVTQEIFRHEIAKKVEELWNKQECSANFSLYFNWEDATFYVERNADIMVDILRDFGYKNLICEKPSSWVIPHFRTVFSLNNPQTLLMEFVKKFPDKNAEIFFCLKQADIFYAYQK